MEQVILPAPFCCVQFFEFHTKFRAVFVQSAVSGIFAPKGVGKIGKIQFSPCLQPLSDKEKSKKDLTASG